MRGCVVNMQWISPLEEKPSLKEITEGEFYKSEVVLIRLKTVILSWVLTRGGMTVTNTGSIFITSKKTLLWSWTMCLYGPTSQTLGKGIGRQLIR